MSVHHSCPWELRCQFIILARADIGGHSALLSRNRAWFYACFISDIGGHSALLSHNRAWFYACFMPRTARASVGEMWYHALNRGNRREAVFLKMRIMRRSWRRWATREPVCPLSFTGRMGTTLGDQWVPPERLRRGLFDHSRDQGSSPAGLATTS